VIWSQQCVRYSEQKSLDACSWSGNKIYGENVIVSWTATTDRLDESAARLDRAVAAATSS
jgi:hypothetical protein